MQSQRIPHMSSHRPQEHNPAQAAKFECAQLAKLSCGARINQAHWVPDYWASPQTGLIAHGSGLEELARAAERAARLRRTPRSFRLQPCSRQLHAQCPIRHSMPQTGHTLQSGCGNSWREESSGEQTSTRPPCLVQGRHAVGTALLGNTSAEPSKAAACP